MPSVHQSVKGSAGLRLPYFSCPTKSALLTSRAANDTFIIGSSATRGSGFSLSYLTLLRLFVSLSLRFIHHVNANAAETTRSPSNRFPIKSIYFTGSPCSQIYASLTLLVKVWLGSLGTGPLLPPEVHEPSQLSR